MIKHQKDSYGDFSQITLINSFSLSHILNNLYLLVAFISIKVTCKYVGHLSMAMTFISL